MLASGPLPGNAYVEGPAAGHTGGFAEATCHECHFDQPINDPEGTLTLKGVPDTYTPGQSYGITNHAEAARDRPGRLSARRSLCHR